MTNEIEGENISSKNNEDNIIKDGGMVDEALSLGGNITNLTKEPSSNDDYVEETLPSGQEIYILPDGTRIDKKSGETILEGSKD
jgi:hypothetical protein